MASWFETYPPHPAANVFPMIEGDWMEDLVEDIQANGIREPVSLWRDPASGRTLTLDGRNRFQAAELGGLALMQVPVRWVETDDPFGFVMSANVIRRHLSLRQRREAAAALIALDPTRSDRQIAKATGVSHPTVGKVRREMEESGDAVRVTTRTDTLGRVQPVPEPSRTYPDPAELQPPPPDPIVAQIIEQDREREAKPSSAIAESPFGSIGSALNWLSNELELDSAELERLVPEYAERTLADGVSPDMLRKAGGFLLLVAAEMRK